ncbi:AMP-binding protein, partial [Polynucleobacter yangtzensis]
ALLAILKAGAAYLPLDPDYPAQRLSFMLSDSGAAHVITNRSTLAHCELTDFANLGLIDLDHPEQVALLEGYETSTIANSERIRPLLPEHLAYVIYTSGSTG